MTSILGITLRSQLVVSGAIKYNILLCIEMKMMIATRVKNKDKEGNAPQHTSHYHISMYSPSVFGLL